MNTRMMCAALTLVMLPLAGLAKPPDLPVRTTGVCAEDQPAFIYVQQQQATWEFVIDEESESAPETCPCLDTSCASVCGVLCRLLQALTGDEAEEAEQLEVMPSEVRASPEQLRQVRHLYHIAGRCWRNGDLAMALSCFDEIVRICPDCRYGRLAREWVARIQPAGVINSFTPRNVVSGLTPAGTLTPDLDGRGSDDAAEESSTDRAEPETATLSMNRCLSTANIVHMVRRQTDDSAIIQRIRVTGSTYSLSPSDIARLREHGVSERVIEEMQRRPSRAKKAEMAEMEELLRKAEQLRIQSQEPPVCPFHKDNGAGQQPTRETAAPTVSARARFREGRRCERNGDLVQAYRCYQQVVALHPKPSLAAKASKRMEQIDILTEDETAEAGIMSDRDVQELLDATELLEADLDDTVQADDAEFKDILVNVQEHPTGDLMFGAGINSNTGLVGSITLNEANFETTPADGAYNTNWIWVVWGTESLTGWVSGGVDFNAAAAPDNTTPVVTVPKAASDLEADEEESEPPDGSRALRDLGRALVGGNIDFMTDGWGSEATLFVNGVLYHFVRNKLGILELVPPESSDEW